MNDDIKIQLYSIYDKASNHRNDGWTQWAAKQKLIELKYFINELVDRCGSFGAEEENFIKQLEQEKLIKILKK